MAKIIFSATNSQKGLLKILSKKLIKNRVKSSLAGIKGDCEPLKPYKMNRFSILLLVLALFTASCGLIDDKDTLPQKPNNNEMKKADEYPSRGVR